MKQITIISTCIALLSIILTGCSFGTGKNVPSNNSMNDLQIDLQTEADEELEAYIDEAFELLKSNGQFSAAIWPEYDLSQNSIIVCQRDDASNKVTHAWKLTTTGKYVLTAEQLSNVEIPAAGSYNSIKFDGQKSIILTISKNTIPPLEKVAITNFIYEIGVHEMVHFHYESPLKLMKLASEQNEHGGRSTTFPKSAEPRVYRQMLYDNLVAAFENPEDEEVYLGKAKYWNEKWKTEFSEEYYQIKITDILEGKARYIQYMLCIPNHLSEAEKVTWIIDHFDKSVNPSVSMDSESYKLGFAAGVILDRHASDWKSHVTKKPEPFVEYLLKNVEVIEDSSENYKEKLETSKVQMAKVNEELDAKLDNIKTAENNIQIPFLQINDNYLAGSFETSDFINYMGKNLIVEFAGTFETKNGTIVVNHVTLYSENRGRKNVYFLPLIMEYDLSDGRLIIDNDEVSCDIPVKQSKDNDGRIIYIME